MDPVTIVAAINALGSLIELIRKSKEVAARNGELTPDQDRALDQLIEDKLSQAHWKV